MGLIWKDPSIMSNLILPLTFLMVYPMMVTMPIRKILEKGSGRVQWAALIMNFGVIPFIALLISRIFFAENPYLTLGILRVSLLPTSGMTISWTGMSKGNMPAAVKMTVIGLLLGSLMTPFYIKAFMGISVSIPFIKIFTQIAVIVVLPMIFGMITQALLIMKHGADIFQKDVKKRFPPFSTLGVLLMVFTAMVLKAKGIAMTSFGKEGSQITLIIALGYIIQIQLSAWYVKLSPRLFGEYKKDKEYKTA